MGIRMRGGPDAKGVGNTDTLAAEQEKKTLTVGCRRGSSPHRQTANEYPRNR